MAKLILKNVRISFAGGKNTIAEKDDFYNPPKYSVQFIISKDDPQVQTFISTANLAIKEGADKFGKGYKCPAYAPGVDVGSNMLQDGDQSEYEPFHGNYYFKATSQFAVGCFSTKRIGGRPQKIEATELYSGDIVNISADINPFRTGKSRGITLYIKGIQATFTGDPLGGGDAENDFDYVESDDTKAVDGGFAPQDGFKGWA